MLIRTHALEYIFEPRTVAVIGASETPASVGRSLMTNLLNSPFSGEVLPVNLHRSTVMGIPAVPHVRELSTPVDLAIVATPARSVVRVVEECAIADFKGAVIISAGFGETGKSGKRLEGRILAAARRSRMRLIGPNCLGIMNPYQGLNASFAPRLARAGSVGLISQSGAMLSAILDWSHQENAGFSKVISIGGMLDVNWSDMIYYLGDDSHTRSIIIYMESIGDPREFLSAAREVARRKPIVLLKAGRSPQTALAVEAHVGNLPGEDLVIDAAFRRSGVLRVERIAELFYMAGVLSKQPRPSGSNLAIISNAGGPAILAADALIAGGGRLATLGKETLNALNDFLPPHWSRSNPVDLLAEASPEQYAQALAIVAKDAEVHGVLIILTPQAVTAPMQTAEAIRETALSTKKPVLASWMGGAEIAAGEAVLNEAEIPTLNYPDSAAKIFNYMWQYARTIERLYETPVYIPELSDEEERLEKVANIMRGAQGQQRSTLTDLEANQVLEAYNIPHRPIALAASATEAVRIAQDVGFPVQVSLNSEAIQNPGELDGVWRNLADAEAVAQAFRALRAITTLHFEEHFFQGVTVQPEIEDVGTCLTIGSHYDPQFGAILRLGGHSSGAELSGDEGVLALPPLTSTLARHLIERAQRLNALGMKSIDIPPSVLETLLVRFSRMISEQIRVRSVEIDLYLENKAQREKAYFVTQNAKIVLHAPDTKDADLTRPAIRSYPSQYVTTWRLRDDTEVKIRPIRPDDEPLMAQFNQTLSKDALFLRYFYPVSASQLTSHDRLARFCFIDYALEMTLVVERPSEADRERREGFANGDSETIETRAVGDSATEDKQIIAVGQLVHLHDRNAAEFALLVGDRFQRQGLGTELLSRLLQIAEDEGISTVIGSILPQNTAMKKICEKLGFTFESEPGSNALLARKDL